MKLFSIKKMRTAVQAVGLALTCLGTAHAALVTIPQSALLSSPGAYTAGGYYTNTLGPNIVTTDGGNAANVGAANGRNDDGFMALNLGFNFTLYGSTYDRLFINNNGNVSFGAGISEYEPTGPTGADAPLISPFFSDVDTRNPDSGVVHYLLTSDQLVVTWDKVGYYSQHSDLTNSFQMVLRADGFATPVGEGVIGFFYQIMGWERTDTSTTAAVGFGDGVGNAVVVEGSNLAGMASTMNNRHIWFNANLTPVDNNNVPEPGSLALLSVAILALTVSAKKRRKPV